MQNLIEQLKAGLDPSRVSPIRVYEVSGKLYSLDNRRLYAAQQAGVSINYRFATPGELVNAAMQGRFSAKPGVPLRIRGREGQE